MVHTAYGDEAVMQSNIFCLYGQFCDGQEDVQGNPRSGRPSDGWQNTKNVQQLLLQNCNLSL
jgi:hypothetical protein